MDIAFLACFYSITFNYELKCSITIGGYRTKELNSLTVTRKVDVRIISCNHLWVSYSPRAYYFQRLSNSGDIVVEFSFYIYGSNNACYGLCGVRLVYKEDMELSQITINKSFVDQDNVYYDTPSKRKRYAIEFLIIHAHKVLIYNIFYLWI